MDRLPPHRFADEEGHQQNPAANQPYPYNNDLASSAAGSTARGSMDAHLPTPPDLHSHPSSTSDSTKYSPTSDDHPPVIQATPNMSTSGLLRDKEGNVYHPQVTFAASPDRPSAYPTLSYGQGQFNNHPGINAPARPGFGATQSDSSVPTTQREGGFSGADFRRKKSLVRPERERFNPDSRNLNYRQHAAAAELEGTGRVNVSNTGYHPGLDAVGIPYGSGGGGISAVGLAPGVDGRPGLRRGKSILAREEGMANESGLSFLKRGATLRRNKHKKEHMGATLDEVKAQKKLQSKTVPEGEKAPLGPWMIYCYVVTFFMPGVLLKAVGLRSLDRRRAFREKIGLLVIIMMLMAAVGFLTFGFTDAVCSNQALRFQAGTIQGGSMIFHGYDYSLDQFKHPAAPGIEGDSNPLYSDWNAGGKDGSFMFQKVNQNCKGLITRASGSSIPYDSSTGNLGWYFPCNLFDQYSTTPVNATGYTQGQLCHTTAAARSHFDESRYKEINGMQWQGPVYYTWDNITNSTRNLGVYKSSVLDFSLLNWLDKRQVNYPAIFDDLARGNSTYEGRDSTMQLLIAGNRTLADCMDDIIRVGFVDSKTIGCVVADIVLYVSLVFILAVVGIKFSLAVIFAWFFGRRLGSFRSESKADRQKREAEVEAWSGDIFRPAPARYRPNVKNNRKSYLPTTSRFTTSSAPARPYSTLNSDSKRQGSHGLKNMLGAGLRGSPPDSPLRSSRSNTSLPLSNHNFEKNGHSRASSFDGIDSHGRPCPFPLDPHVIPQPPPDYRPFNYQLAHTFLLVTAYSESVEGLRTTLDSLATTDYPNSHKCILVIADGIVKGAGNSMSTPDICLSMMKDLVVPKEDVEPLSYVAVADGHKRHNMAKVYAGFYDYDDESVETSKQQRVPMILVAKCGNPLEAHDAKPGNRGKRDSQVLLMAFLQKVMFDERMTSFECEFFNSIWRVTGISADNYEHVLMVDADTKVFPDSVTRMVACMAQDVDIMGLCGETKIANKSETWVTMIQVFEYYISHHQTKAFESMWGGVTCLPGCFSMYRIKAPKGGDGYWVPILANPDIVEHYSENVVDTLHKKNLLLLGEDRYLSTLMLKTFPKRKMMFCPQAYCKTVVPDTFRVLLSQRRRWINSTIHNLFELLLVRDLCGTFCFSMQFVVFMELVGTLVLPAAIAFTIYILAITCSPREPKPIIPLILLACILGLPGVLIVVTSRKFVFIGWMVIYLFSLPIWNAVLPAYAYFHMDDFSWGSTRKVEGEAKGAAHGDKDGEFDSTSITMKRWSEWERERRWKNGTRSRDSSYDVIQRSASPNRSYTNRTSIISTDTYVSQSLGAQHNPQDPFARQAGTPSGFSPHLPGSPSLGRRVDSVQVLELPAPLAVTQQTQPYQHIPSHPEIYDPVDPASLHSYEASPYQSSSSENIHRAPTPASKTEDDYPRYPHAESYDSDSAEREAILPAAAPSPTSYAPASPRARNTLSVDTGNLRVSSGRSLSTNTAVSSTATRPVTATATAASSAPSRGVSLYDPGPVSAPGGAVRIVQRNRRSSQGRGRQSTDFASSPTSNNFSLPPGAAPRSP